MLRVIVSYERDKILHSSKLVLPALVLIAFFGLTYSTAPQIILSSFSICSLVVYCVMLSIGVTNDDLNNPMIDQTIIVKMRHRASFYLGKVLMAAIISLLVSVISVLVPLLINIARNNALFDRAVVLSDIVSGLVFFWLIGLSGGIFGLFANYRIIRNRKLAIILSSFLGLFVIIEGPITRMVPQISYISWLFPPVYALNAAYSQNTYFDLSGTFVYFLWISVYILVETAVYVFVMLKRKFD